MLLTDSGGYILKCCGTEPSATCTAVSLSGAARPECLASTFLGDRSLFFGDRSSLCLDCRCTTSFLANLAGLGARTESEAGGPARTHTSTVAGACRMREFLQSSSGHGMFPASGSRSLLCLARLVVCSSEAVQASVLFQIWAGVADTIKP